MMLEITYRAGKTLAPTITPLVRKVVFAVLAAEGAPEDCAVSIRFVGKKAIRDANTRFREVDRVTDVLSFPLLSFERPSAFPNRKEDPGAFDPESGALCMGDILLCVPRAPAPAMNPGMGGMGGMM